MKSAIQQEKVKSGRTVLRVRGLSQTLIMLLLIGAGIATSERGIAQSEQRSLRIWVDTLGFNFCEVENSAEMENDVLFDNWGVWLESFADEDTTIGFRVQDSVLVCTLTLRWDTSRIQLQPPYILTPPQTVFGRFASKVQSVDTVEGLLWVSVSPAPEGAIRPAVGTGIPLFYMKGKLKRGEELVEPPEAGARVQSIEIEGKLGENLGSSRFISGFVKVQRDTTLEYAGTLKVTEGDLDTNQVDTVELYVRNIANHKVREIRFSLINEGAGVKFVDTIEAGPGRTGEWNVRDLTVTSEKITGYFTSDADITSDDSLLVRILLERTTDSAFESSLIIDEFSLNEQSCLGKLFVENAGVVGKLIPTDTVDTTMSVVNRSRGEESGVEVVLSKETNILQVTSARQSSIQSVTIYDIKGSRIAYVENLERGKSVVVKMEKNVRRGKYFVVIRGSEGRFWNRQFIL